LKSIRGKFLVKEMSDGMNGAIDSCPSARLDHF